MSDDVTRRTEIGSVTSIGDCSDIFDTDSQFIDSNQDVVSISDFQHWFPVLI